MELTAEERYGPRLAADDPGLVTAEKIVEAVEQIVRIAHPVRVVAFGSRARGDHRRESDLDLAVVVDRLEKGRANRPIWRANVDVWMDMDLMVYDVARERFMEDAIASLQSEVKREGVLLYERATGTIDRAAAARLV